MPGSSRHAIRWLDSGVAKSIAEQRFGDPAARLYRIVLYQGRAEGTAIDGSFQNRAPSAAPFPLSESNGSVRAWI